MSRRRLLVATFAVALAGCGNAGLRDAGTPAVAPAPAASAAGWQQIPLADLDSRPVTLAKLLAGRPALVNLWAPWCERCKTELPDLDRLSRRLEGCGVIVGVAVGEDAPHTAAFVHERGLGLSAGRRRGLSSGGRAPAESGSDHADRRRKRGDRPRRVGARPGGGRCARGCAQPRGRRWALQEKPARWLNLGRPSQATTNHRGGPAKFRGHDAANKDAARRAPRKLSLLRWSGVEYIICILVGPCLEA